MFATFDVPTPTGSGPDGDDVVDEIVVEDPCPHGIPAYLCEDLCWPDAELGAAPVVDLDRAPGASLALDCQCAGAVPGLLSAGQVLDVAEGTEGVLRWAMGLRLRMLAEFADRHPPGTSAAPPGADESAVTPVNRWVPDEVGLTLGLSRLEALGQIALAQRLAHVLPDTLATLERGLIDLRRAEAIAQSTAVLPDDKARAVEAAVLPKAPDATLRQLRDRIRRAIARIDPDGEHRRHRAANAERRLSIRSLEDGMASLWFYGPAEQIEAAWQMADRLARAQCADDPRTLDQRRFDLAVQVLHGKLTVTDMSDLDVSDLDTSVGSAPATVAPATVGHDAAEPGDDGTGAGAAVLSGSSSDERPAGADTDLGAEAGAGAGTASTGDGVSTAGCSGQGPSASRISPEILTEAVVRALAGRPAVHATVHKPLIHVVVALDTLLGGERPAELVGHGPITALTARALAAGGVWQRLVTDPLSGTLLDHGRTAYAPPDALYDHVRARDVVCRGPRCPGRIRDLDHHIPWGQGHEGRTDENNLYGYCKHDHLLKDALGWQVLAHPDRSLTWISPCGRQTTTEPYDFRPFTDELPVPTGPARAGPAAEAPEQAAGHEDTDPPPF